MLPTITMTLSYNMYFSIEHWLVGGHYLGICTRYGAYTCVYHCEYLYPTVNLSVASSPLNEYLYF